MNRSEYILESSLTVVLNTEIHLEYTVTCNNSSDSMAVSPTQFQYVLLRYSIAVTQFGTVTLFDRCYSIPSTVTLLNDCYSIPVLLRYFGGLLLYSYCYSIRYCYAIPLLLNFQGLLRYSWLLLNCVLLLNYSTVTLWLCYCYSIFSQNAKPVTQLWIYCYSILPISLWAAYGPMWRPTAQPRYGSDRLGRHLDPCPTPMVVSPPVFAPWGLENRPQNWVTVNNSVLGCYSICFPPVIVLRSWGS
jgi:hypothetical protein